MKKNVLVIGSAAAILVALVAAITILPSKQDVVDAMLNTEPLTPPRPPIPDSPATADASGLKRMAVPLTVLTYNTHLFAGSNAVPARKVEQKYRPGAADEVVFEDSIRAELIARKIETSGADVVALQELWSCGRPGWFADRLQSVYAYQHSYTVQCPKEMSFAALNAEMRQAGKDAAISYCKKHWYVKCAPVVYHWFAKDYEEWAVRLPGVTEAALNVLKKHKVMNGLLLLSKYPIEAAEFHEYTPGPTQLGADSLARKGIITATIRLPGDVPLRVGITHANTGVGARNDTTYWADVADFARWTSTAQTTGPAIMMGDLNVHDRDSSAPEHASAKYEQMAGVFAEVGAVDADRQLNKRNSTTIDGRANTLLRYFFPKDTAQVVGIDYVFYRPGGAGVKIKAETATAITNWKYSTQMNGKPTEVDLSDHYPLLVRFSLWTAPRPIM